MPGGMEPGVENRWCGFDSNHTSTASQIPNLGNLRNQYVLAPCGEGNRPGICCVFAHGAPETPVLVFGRKDRAHLFVSVFGGGNPLRVTDHSRCDGGRAKRNRALFHCYDSGVLIMM